MITNQIETLLKINRIADKYGARTEHDVRGKVSLIRGINREVLHFAISEICDKGIAIAQGIDVVEGVLHVNYGL